MSNIDQITRIINDDYGVGVVVCPPAACLWAAAQCSDPRKALKALNAVRRKHGAPVVHAPYGDPAF